MASAIFSSHPGDADEVEKKIRGLRRRETPGGEKSWRLPTLVTASLSPPDAGFTVKMARKKLRDIEKLKEKVPFFAAFYCCRKWSWKVVFFTGSYRCKLGSLAEAETGRWSRNPSAASWCHSVGLLVLISRNHKSWWDFLGPMILKMLTIPMCPQIIHLLLKTYPSLTWRFILFRMPFWAIYIILNKYIRIYNIQKKASAWYWSPPFPRIRSLGGEPWVREIATSGVGWECKHLWL